MLATTFFQSSDTVYHMLECLLVLGVAIGRIPTTESLAGIY